MNNQPPQYPGQQDPGQPYPGPQFQGQQFQGQQPPMPGQAPGFYGPPQPPMKPRKPWFKRFWVWAVAIIVIIGASQAFNGNGSSTTASDQQDAQALTQSSGKAATTAAKAKAPASTTQAKPTERLTLDQGWKIDKSNPFGVYVRGYVSNNSDKPLTNYAQITFDVLDKSGANLGSCLANTNSIDAHGKWKFEAICDGDSADVAKVRFKDISGF